MRLLRVAVGTRRRQQLPQSQDVAADAFQRVVVWTEAHHWLYNALVSTWKGCYAMIQVVLARHAHQVAYCACFKHGQQPLLATAAPKHNLRGTSANAQDARSSVLGPHLRGRILDVKQLFFGVKLLQSEVSLAQWGRVVVIGQQLALKKLRGNTLAHQAVTARSLRR